MTCSVCAFRGRKQQKPTRFGSVCRTCFLVRDTSLKDADVEKIYVVISGEVTVETTRESVTLRPLIVVD